MRPNILYPLFAPIDTLSGIGQRYFRLISNLCGNKIIDMLWHIPSGYIDRRCNLHLNQAQNGHLWTGSVSVVEHIAPKSRKQPYRIIVADSTEQLTLVFFKTFGDHLTKLMPVGAQKIISGKIEIFNQNLQMTHPDYIVDPNKAENIPLIETVYPLTAGITNKMMYKLMAQVMDRIPDLPEWLENNMIQQHQFPNFKTAVWNIHHPQSIQDLAPISPCRQRLAYDELLANQLSLAIVRNRMKKMSGKSLHGSGMLREKLKSVLPFELTSAQESVISEILHDMQSPYKMSRLLQGDVGSGKTIVALMTMLNAVECSTQSAIMAPTEILAQQHYETLLPYCEKIGIHISLLTGSIKGKKRQNILEDLKDGHIDILIGTHALFTESVEFKNLAYVIIDEQHRFGVKQRLNLSEKGKNCDVLVMTATPIPRTLVLTQFGDMDYSKINQLPVGRQPVSTKVMPLTKIHDVVNALRRKLSNTTQAYWVCPLVEESEKIDLSAAAERYESLKTLFGEQNVGLIHGKMKEAEKTLVMDAFKAGKIKLLVSTTVIEVGVNVPAATVMIIEHAERFGLAQLHQLRGRIKRGSEASNCILLYGFPLSEIARSRLNIMKQTEDGFQIAEEDLKLRGGGEILGIRQSGFSNFRLADIEYHQDLLIKAHKDAVTILAQDPSLSSPRGQALRTLLYLFEQDSAIKTYNAG